MMALFGAASLSIRSTRFSASRDNVEAGQLLRRLSRLEYLSSPTPKSGACRCLVDDNWRRSATFAS